MQELNSVDHEGAPDPAAIAYRDDSLGTFSSHPYWLARGGRLVQRALVSALILVWCLTLYVWLRGHSLASLVPALWSWSTGIGGFAALAVAGIAFGMTLAVPVQLRAALGHVASEVHSPGTIGRFGVAIRPLLVLLGAGFVLPILLVLLPGLPVELRLLGVLVAVLPAALLYYLLPAGPDERRRFPWGSICLVLVLLVAIGFVRDLVGWLASLLPPALRDYFPRLADADGLRSALLLLLVGVGIYGLLKLSLWKRGQPTTPSLRVERPEGNRETETGSKEQPAGDWVARLASLIGAGPSSVQLLAPEPGETVGWAEQSEFKILFDGHQPTRDQHEALAHLTSLLGEMPHAKPGEAPRIGFEMILEGPPGTGRTEVLDAAALLAATSLGQRAVLFVAYPSRVELAVRRLRDKIDRLHLTGFLRVAPLRETIRARETRDPLPEICVTTPEEWETSLPGVASADGEAFENAKAIMVAYTLVLVDDWMEHPIPIRMHLPFIVDKHRLLLDSVMRPSIRVYVFPRMDEKGRDLVIPRLIGSDGMIDLQRQMIPLRYRPDIVAQVLQVSTDDVEAKILTITDALCSEGHGPVLMRRGIDPEEASRQTQELRSRFPDAKIKVCHCDDELDAELGEGAAIIMKAADGPDAVLAIRTHGSADLVVICVHSALELPAPSAVTPLIVDRSGRGMAEAHLYNILRFIDARTPIAQRSWGQLGFPDVIGDTARAGHVAGRLLLDRPNSDIAEEERRGRPYLSTLGAFMALEARFKFYSPVDCTLIPEPGADWWYSDSDPVFGPDRVNLPDRVNGSNLSKDAILRWKGNDGVELGRSQLHYTTELVLRRTQTYCPMAIHIDKMRGVEVTTTIFKDNGQDAIHPKFHIGWTQERPPEAPGTGIGGPSQGYLWMEVRGSAGVEVTGRLGERTDANDRPTPCPAIEFHYHAFVTPLLLLPTDTVTERTEDFLKAFGDLLSSSRAWSIEEPSFLAGLTYAFTRCIETDMPGAGAFGKVLVFSLTDTPLAEFASAIVWFVEPIGTGTTLSSAFRQLCRDDRFLQQFISRLQRVLGQGWDESPTIELARFWLPKAYRKILASRETGIGQFKVLDELMDVQREKVPLTGPDQMVQVTCPQCSHTVSTPFVPGRGITTVSHCDKPITVLVTTTGGAATTPKSLLQPWWPDGVEPPTGTDSERVRAIHQLVAERIYYNFDFSEGGRFTECWSAAAHSWERGVGDCEDHSILIVSMLRSIGISAWVTVGDVTQRERKGKKEGHAWVEAEIEGRLIIIEATHKGPFPDRYPTLGETIDAWFAKYEAWTHLPARCDGVKYQKKVGSGWEDIDLVDRITVVPTPEDSPIDVAR